MSRAERLSHLLRNEIGTIILTKLNDHRIGFVSITDVEVSDDLSYAKILYSCFGSEEEKKKTLKGLMSAIPVIRSILAETIELRIVPKLRFVQDDSIEEGDRKLAILNKLAAERAAREQQQPTPQE
jgi:ribosome-binding factor A